MWVTTLPNTLFPQRLSSTCFLVDYNFRMTFATWCLASMCGECIALRSPVPR